MRPGTARRLTVVAIIAVTAICRSSAPAAVNNISLDKTTRHHLQLHKSRVADSDLEVTGLIPGLSPGQSGYVRYADLLKLPHIVFPLQETGDFPGLEPDQRIQIAGVYLDSISHDLGVLPASDLIDATCQDEYRAHYPSGYITAHHPVLALTIDQLSTSAWALKTKQTDLGPYFITHVRFTPSFKLLSHSDQPQLPINVVRLNFTTTAATFGSISPPAGFAPNSPEQEGFTIAKQNCLRCHNQDQYGGKQSGRDWTMLSVLAYKQPTYFASYVKNPQAFNANARMSGNLQYDTATLDAITAYFKSLANQDPSPDRQ